jgi:dTDP-4-dehydrorhamnose 3,5-epimerase
MVFPEVKIYRPDSYEDFRGELFTLYKSGDWENMVFNHDKVSISRKNVLRGMHGDSKAHKLITCLSGEVLLVVIDNRKESPNYLKWDSVILSEKNKTQILLPPMFANGHLVLSETATFFYKWSYAGSYPDVDQQFTIKWDDPNVGIFWPISNPILAERDK